MNARIQPMQARAANAQMALLICVVGAGIVVR
jgi:hypothetical protein